MLRKHGNTNSRVTPLFLKTKLCKFHQVGACKRGTNCTYAHDPSELQQMPDFSCTRICPLLKSQGHCPKGAECKFAHATDELRARTPEHAKSLAKLHAKAVGDDAAVPPPPSAPALDLPSPTNQPAPDSDAAALLPPYIFAEQDKAPGGAPSCGQSTAEDKSSTASVSGDSEWEEATEETEVSPANSETRPQSVHAVAAILGMNVSIKSTFLEFNNAAEPVSRLRRTRSTGDLPTAACH